jgi:hypothetical protein
MTVWMQVSRKYRCSTNRLLMVEGVGAAGLSLSYALTFTDFVLWIVRLWAANEQNMTSVERLRDCKSGRSRSLRGDFLILILVL